MNGRRLSDARDTLYPLLPAIYRLRDDAEGRPLRALLAIIDEQLRAVREDIDGLYDDWFIETCAGWVMPYIGELVGNRPLHEIKQLRRTDIAKTITYRRRKGTLAMLEEMARDVTGWGAHAVEFFELLNWTQNLNHQRLAMAENPDGLSPNAVDRVGTANLRSRDVLDRLDGPFDVTSHTVDVRPVRQHDGWHNIRHIGFFLWRLDHYPLTGAAARAEGGIDYGVYFSQLGRNAPLFNHPQREADPAGLATELHVPGPIRPGAFYADLQTYEARFGALPPADQPENSDYYGPARSLNIVSGGVPVPVRDIVCKDLSTWQAAPAGRVAVDVALGRIAFPAGESPAEVLVDYSYGFSADLGGGPYDRRQSLTMPRLDLLWLPVAKHTARDTIQKALAEWQAEGEPPCVIQIEDSQVYGGNLDITLPAGGWVAIQAANGQRPDLRLVGVASLDAPDGGALLLDGLLVQGAFELGGALDLQLRHCTLVPGRFLNPDGLPLYPDRDSLTVDAATADMRVTISHSITGPIRLPGNIAGLAISDSIVHAPRVGGVLRPAIAGNDAGDEPGPVTTLERVTVWGPALLKELALASAVIFNSPVTVQRQQEGCIRFSYVPPGSPTPRRYRCQPDAALRARASELGLTEVADLPAGERARVLARLRPEYTSELVGDPGYAQLSLSCAEEILGGGPDGAEMGCFHSLKNPQRLANLQLRLDEYLPFGLKAGFIAVT
jgi:hypothetical protein